MFPAGAKVFSRILIELCEFHLADPALGIAGDLFQRRTVEIWLVVSQRREGVPIAGELLEGIR